MPGIGCSSTEGVVKRIELEKISKEISSLACGLDEEVKVDVSEIRKYQSELERLISGEKNK